MGGILDNCSSERFRSKGKVGIDTNTIMWITKRNSAVGCDIKSFANTQGVDDTVVTYSRMDKPDDRACGLKSCDMYGSITANSETTVKTETEFAIDGEKYAYGYIEFQVYVETAPANFTFDVYTPGDSANANQYTYQAKKDGWNTVLLDLTNPGTVLGTGFVGTTEGIALAITQSDVTDLKLSTLRPIESLDEMSLTNRVGLTCITDWSGDIALTQTTGQCVVTKNDTAGTAISKTATGAKVIGDLNSAMPGYKKSKSTKFVANRTVSKIATLETFDGIDFAVVELANVATACPSLVVQPKSCDGEVLYDSGANGIVELTDEYYIYNEGTVYMHSMYVGSEVLVNYPQEFDGVAWKFGNEWLNDGTNEMEIELDEGKETVLIKANNVHFQNMPLAWTSTENNYTFTFTMDEDEDGVMYEAIKAVKE